MADDLLSTGGVLATIGAWAGRLAATAASAVEPDALPPADHRPWPPPSAPWAMAQTWEDLLFAHWPVDRSALARLVPSRLLLDTFDGSAWLAVTPFRLTGLRSRGLPALPGLSEFPEINCRTYVTAGGKPGVFFLSLDAGHALAVAVARRLYHLPYFRADFSVTRDGERVRYRSQRTEPGAPPAEFRAEYGPTGDVAPAVPGSLAWWLTERYCLYSVDGEGALYRAEIHHVPWPLQPAAAEIARNTLPRAHDVELPDTPPLLHFARRLDVRVWLPERVTVV